MRKIGAAVGCLVLPLVSLSSALAQPINGCSAAAQQTGDCVGWAGFAEENPLLASIRSQLLVGRVQQAQHFFDRVQSRLSTAESRTAALALTTARTSGSSAAAAQLQPNLSLAAVTAVPPQQTHGEAKAISYYSWLLHGSHAVNVYYGSCSAWTQSCSTGGWWVFDHSANTLFSGDGAYFLEDARKGGGVDARIIDHKVRLLQDITNSPDPTKATLPCQSSTTYGLGPHCSAYSKPAMTTGNPR
jgi:hypothetical protein